MCVCVCVCGLFAYVRMFTCVRVLLASVYGMCVCVFFVLFFFVRAYVYMSIHVRVIRCVCVYVCYHAFVFVYVCAHAFFIS